MIGIRVGNVKTHLVGDIAEDVFYYLDQELSYEMPDADKIRRFALSKPPRTREDFIERNRMAEWDGRKHLLTPKLKRFPTGLVSRVVRLLNAANVPYRIIDERVSLNRRRYNPMRHTETLRHYQHEAVEAAIKSEMGTIRVPTGGGKTRIGCAILSELALPSLFLVTRKDLLHQAIANFRELLFRGEEVVGQVGDGVFDPRFVTVATIQSICAALGQKAAVDEEGKREDTKAARAHEPMIRSMLSATEVIIMDEVQHIAAQTCLGVMEQCVNAKYRFGLSATDWRDDGADLLIEGAVGPRVTNVSMTDLVSWGYLVPPRITTYTMAEPEGGWALQADGSDWHQVYRYFYIENVPFHHQVADIVRGWLAANRTILTLVVSVEHGKALEQLHHDLGLPAVFLSGISSSRRRAQVLEDVRSGKLRHLIATSIADEGLDLPLLDALILAGGGKSSTRVMQRIGRVLRPAPGKTEGLVAEFLCPDHQWLKEQYRKRALLYANEPAFILE